MTANNSNPKIVAHRGSSYAAPENTLIAFSLALEKGADGIEFDIRIAKDGVPVVFHDSSLGRIAGEDGRVSSYTSGELRQVSVGDWFNMRNPKRARKEYRAATIPTLEETLNHLRGFKGTIYAELKCKETEIAKTVDSVVELLEGTDLFPRIIFKSFMPNVLPELKRCCPEAGTAALFAPRIMNVLRKEKRLVKIAKELSADRLSVHYSLATRKLMKHARRYELPVTIWTADRPRWVKKSLEMGIDSIITDRPGRMLLKRRELHHKNSILA